MCVWLVVEDGGIECAIAGRSADPVGIRGAEAKVGALVKGFESAISEEVLSLVPASSGDLEIALAVVGGGRSVRRDIILSTINMAISMERERAHQAAAVRRWASIDHRSPDVEVLASTTLAVSAPFVPFSSTSVHVIAIKENEAHVL